MCVDLWAAGFSFRSQHMQRTADCYSLCDFIPRYKTFLIFYFWIMLNSCMPTVYVKWRFFKNNLFFGNNYYNASQCLEEKSIGHGQVNDVISLEIIRSCKFVYSQIKYLLHVSPKIWKKLNTLYKTVKIHHINVKILKLAEINK